VPCRSTSAAEALLLVDLVVLIYFIHHIAKSIQLPEVIAGIANDLTLAIDTEFPMPAGTPVALTTADGERSVDELIELLEEGGIVVPATISGYLQFVGFSQLVAIGERTDSVIRLAHRPGHFIVAGRPLATVWPPDAAAEVAGDLKRAHVTGPHRTLIQDPVFAIDQLAEIAIRALSPAVNDTFTALTCIDWLSAGLCRMSGRALTEGIYRDRTGRIRLIEHDPSYARMVNRAFDKIRQAARGMPAVIIRLLDALANVMENTVGPEQRRVLMRQAEMILRAGESTIDEEMDLEDVRRRYRRIVAIGMRLEDGTALRPRWEPADGGSRGSRRRSRSGSGR
jgi:uncharacterized membrane protein